MSVFVGDFVRKTHLSLRGDFRWVPWAWVFRGFGRQWAKLSCLSGGGMGTPIRFSTALAAFEGRPWRLRATTFIEIQGDTAGRGWFSRYPTSGNTFCQ